MKWKYGPVITKGTKSSEDEIGPHADKKGYSARVGKGSRSKVDISRHPDMHPPVSKHGYLQNKREYC